MAAARGIPVAMSAAAGQALAGLRGGRSPRPQAGALSASAAHASGRRRPSRVCTVGGRVRDETADARCRPRTWVDRRDEACDEMCGAAVEEVCTCTCRARERRNGRHTIIGLPGVGADARARI
jgi:hypothetical protein